MIIVWGYELVIVTMMCSEWPNRTWNAKCYHHRVFPSVFTFELKNKQQQKNCLLSLNFLCLIWIKNY